MNPVATLLLFPFQPRKVALAHQNTPLWRVYLIHWLGLLVLAGVLIGLDYLGLHLHPRHTLVVRKVVKNLDAAVIVIFVTLCGEGVFVLVGTVMTCWAGADEPIGCTWRHALRVSWLFVAHLSWIVVGCGLTGFVCEVLDVRENGTVLAVMIVMAIIIWSIASYLRAMTVSRHVELVETDPMCEWCGYNVAHLDPKGRCPECGRPIDDSLRVQTRRPFAREYHLDSSSRVWLNPEALFRGIAMTTPSRDAVVFFLQMLLVTAFTASFSLGATISIFEGVLDPVLVVSCGLFVFGAFVGWSYLMLASAAASGVGFIASRRSGRNRFVAGFMVVALTSNLYPPWACVAIVTLVVATIKLQSRPEVFWLVFITLNTIVAIFYCRALARRMQFLQYANR